METNGVNDLLSDVIQIFHYSKYPDINDVKIISSDGREFYKCGIFLASRSSYFAKLIYSSKTKKKRIKIKKIKGVILKYILEYLCTGKINILEQNKTKPSVKFIFILFQILKASYVIHESHLIHHCIQIFIQILNNHHKFVCIIAELLLNNKFIDITRFNIVLKHIIQIIHKHPVQAFRVSTCLNDSNCPRRPFNHIPQNQFGITQLSFGTLLKIVQSGFLYKKSFVNAEYFTLCIFCWAAIAQIENPAAIEDQGQREDGKNRQPKQHNDKEMGEGEHEGDNKGDDSDDEGDDEGYDDDLNMNVPTSTFSHVEYSKKCESQQMQIDISTNDSEFESTDPNLQGKLKERDERIIRLGQAQQLLEYGHLGEMRVIFMEKVLERMHLMDIGKLCEHYRQHAIRVYNDNKQSNATTITTISIINPLVCDCPLF